MKNNKRIVSFLTSVLFSVNSIFPILTVAEDTEDVVNPYTVMISEEFLAAELVPDKIYDKNSSSTLYFENALTCDSDEIQKLILVADADYGEYSDVTAEPVDVTLSNFRIEGEGAELYVLDYPEIIVKKGYIVPRNVTVIPHIMVAVTGSEELRNIDTENVPYDFDVTDILPGDDLTGASLRLRINDFTDAVGRYDFELADIDMTTVSNYCPVLEADAVFEVMGKAPLITNVEYTSDITVNDFGAFANQRMVITVTAVSIDNSDTNVYLRYGQTSVEADNTRALTDNGKYIINYSFTLDIPEDIGYLDSDIYICAENLYGKADDEPLQFRYVNAQGTEEFTSRLVIERELPEANGTIIYNNNEHYFDGNVNISDAKSGIASIEYRWDRDSQWYTYGQQSSGKYTEGHINGSNMGQVFNIDSRPGGNISFNVRVPYENSQNVAGNDHILYLRITDNAGNVLEISSRDDSFSTNGGQDMEAPEITLFEIVPVKTQNVKEDEEEKEVPVPLADIMTVKPYGNFFSDSFYVNIKAVDKSSSSSYKSGISSISIVDGKNEIASLNGKDDDDYVYIFKLDKKTNINEFAVKLQDNGGMERIVPLMAVADKSLGIKTNKVVCEKSIPTVEADYSGCVGGERASDGNYWYRGDDKNFIINISDSNPDNHVSGIGYVSVSIDGNLSKSYSLDYGKIQFSDNEQIIIDTSQLTDGEHVIKVKAYDNCKNMSSEEKYIINVDNSSIKVSLTLDKNAPLVKNEWLKSDDKVSFYVDVVSEYSELKGISLKINNNLYNCTLTKDEENSSMYHGKYTVYLSEKSKGIPVYYNLNNIMNVSAEAYAYSGSTGVTESCVYNIDTDIPYIENFTVSTDILSEESPVNKFGVFSNKSLVFRAYAKDGKYDSGIKEVVMEYVNPFTDEKVKKFMQYDKEEKCYYISIPVSAKVFSSNILVTVYDEVGRYGIDCPNNENTIKGYGIKNNVFTMIEENLPNGKIVIPDSDGKQQDKIWYRTDKTICLYAGDYDSGIKDIIFTVNGQRITSDKFGNNLITPDIALNSEERYVEQLQYFFSTSEISNNIIPDKDGGYTLEAKIVDIAGNVCNVEKKLFYIDTEAPVIENIIFERASVDNISTVSELNEAQNDENGFIILRYGYYFNDDIMIYVKVTDHSPSSGIDKIKYRLSSGNGSMVQSTGMEDADVNSEGIASFVVPKGFKGQIYLKAFDNVGNGEEVPEKTPDGFVVDNIKPEVTITNINDVQMTSEKLYNSKQTFLIEVSDTMSGIRDINSYLNIGEKTTQLENVSFSNSVVYTVGQQVDGWTVNEVDQNIVTKASKEVTIDADENDIIISCNVHDRSSNENVKESPKFSIDLTAPQLTVIYVDNEEEVDVAKEKYLNNKKLKIKIELTDKNFDSDSANATVVVNNYYDKGKPVYNEKTTNIALVQSDKYKWTAEYELPDGDYDINLVYSDKAGRKSNPHNHIFSVDTKKPVIETNFDEFTSENKKMYFNTDKTIKIKVKEHNFPDNQYGNLTLEIKKYAPGTKVESNSFDDISYKASFKKSENDVYECILELFEKNAEAGKFDGVYKVKLQIEDKAGNITELFETGLFEIDTIAPELVGRHGVSVKNINDNDITVYTKSDNNIELPSLEFSDTNYEKVKLYIMSIVPNKISNAPFEKHSTSDAINIYQSGKRNDSGNSYFEELNKLTEYDSKNNFVSSEYKSAELVSNKKLIEAIEYMNTIRSKDGVYVIEAVAVDFAGNESEVIYDTNFRMYDTQMLSYIPNSKPGENDEDGTGLYSFMTDGRPKSIRSSDFKKTDIVVVTSNNENVGAKLVDEKDKTLDVGNAVEKRTIANGVTFYDFVVDSAFFTNNLPNDTDSTMFMQSYISDQCEDLGIVHIDNEPPAYSLPKHLKTRGFYNGSAENYELQFRIENNDELSASSYVEYGVKGGKRISIPISFDASTDIATFTLPKGMYDVRIVLYDEARNETQVPEIKNLILGNGAMVKFIIIRILIVLLLILLVIAAAFVCIKLFRRRKLF